MPDRTDSAGSSSGNRWRCRVHRNESGAAPRTKQMGAHDWQAMPATRSHWAADITATTTEAAMIESIIVYSLLLWGCWLAAQSLTPESDA